MFLIQDFMKSIKRLIILLLIVVTAYNADAAHIVGGEAYYTFVRFNSDTTEVTYNIEFVMYRDTESNGAMFDSPAVFGIYEQQSDGTWDFIDALTDQNPGQVIPVIPVDDPCVDEPDNVGVEKTNYTFQYTFDIIDRSYLIAYQRCCRNNTINNIRDPGETGAVFDIEISAAAQIAGNSSPKFQNFPPIFICQGLDLVFDHSAVDIDPEGDVLRYTFCAPFESGGTVDANNGGNQGCCQCVRPNPSLCRPGYGNVVFTPPFTAQRPLAGNPVVSINPLTGLITGRPETLGQFVVGVCVEEFRNGILLSTVRRDFQFNVVVCTPTVIAEFAYEIIDTGGGSSADDCKAFSINSCGENTISIINDSRQEANIFAYHWTFFNPDGSVLNDVQGGPELRDIDVTFPDIGQYQGLMILNEGTACSDSACFFINIYPSIDADFSFDYDTCVAGPINFTDLSVTGAAGGIVDWSWSFENSEFADDQNPLFRFATPGILPIRLTVEDDNECTDVAIIDVDYRPAPDVIIVEPSSFVGCTPAEIFFNNLSTPIDSTYDIVWDLGDGTISTDISPTHIYEEPGTYSVSLSITSPIGCETTKPFPSWIRILEGPTADFAFSPDEPNNFNSLVQFTDLSTLADKWQWNFGTVGSSQLSDPNFDFPDTGLYDVKLTVFHPITRCPDTISKIIDIRPQVKLFMPNAFTPNNDATNDTFLGNGFYDGLLDFSMTVWNRWGERVYETTDPRSGWNGQKNNNGAQSPQGVYVYKVTYATPRGEREIIDGHVTLLR
jgi:gliding motility-associated-like protein